MSRILQHPSVDEARGIDPLHDDALLEVLEHNRVQPAFQPIIDLEREVTVGYEALARTDVTALRSPDELFQAGRAAGRLPELDWLCREQAVAAARAAGLRYPLSLFINAEPETLLAAERDAQRWARFGDLRCYAELTERALAAHPAGLLRAIDQVRNQDWGIALDDVGADPGSLALLPVIRPDVIKLDLALLHTDAERPGDLTVAAVLHPALRQATDSGAVVVAEGIETEQHLDLARAIGAHYGQGFLLGRPGPLPTTFTGPHRAVPLLPRAWDRNVLPGPFSIVAGAAGTRRVSRTSVVEIARQLLAQACQLDPAPIVLVCANHPDTLTDDLCSLLLSLHRAPLIGAVGSASALDRLPALRTQRLDPVDPARHDFDVIIVGANYSAALVARPALQPPLGDAMLDMTLSFDAGLVATAAHTLLSRLP